MRWRAGVVVLLLLLAGVPLAWPVGQLAAAPQGWRSLADAGRLLGLGRNTLLLVGGTLALCLPAGTAAAVLLYRTDLPGRAGLRLATILTLFVPFPLWTAGWQSALGAGGLLGEPGWTPWAEGLRAAIGLHALAGLPWVILIAGVGLCAVEPELEEDALMITGGWGVLWHVTLPRSAAALGASALWVGLQTATEITVTDLMQVRTFAEEVYTQLVGPEVDSSGADVVARAVAVSLPSVVLLALLVVGLTRRWERALPPRLDGGAPPLRFSLGRWRWPLGCLALLLAAVLLAVPTASLVWRAGLTGSPPAWSASALVRQLLLTAQTGGRLIVDSLFVAAAGGAVCAGLALLACWLALGAGWFRTFVLVLMAVAWAMPGPVVGLGLKGVVDGLLRGTDSPLLARLLWHGPSYAPILWTDIIRFFPCAVAVLWPVVRLLPRTLLESARLEGARPGQELALVVAPLSAGACGRAALVVAVLALGELSAGKLVSTPGAPTYAQEVFAQMHYGVTAHLAAQCLVLLGVVALGGALVAWVTAGGEG
jgi:iron(III) transport system permease protein